MRILLLLAALVVPLTGCGSGGESAAHDTPCQRLDRHPVTTSRLAEVFQSEGLSLVSNRRACEPPESYRPDATNAGPLGLKRDPEVWRTEGSVSCYLGSGTDPSEGKHVRREHFEGEQETWLYALNVSCSVRPSDEGRAEEQIARVEAALHVVDEAR